MCIAIVKTKGATISDEALKNCWDNNPDGAGFAYPKNGEVVIEKGFFKYDSFLNRLREVEKENDTAMLIHFRISTSGNIDKLNCHPHRVNKKLVMIHNGILHIDVPKDSKVSDTVLYCENYLKKLPKNFEYSDVMLEYIAEHIGSFNKFCFINAKGDYAICNESAGTWDSGVWYSNTTYKAPRVKWGGKIHSYWNGSYYGNSSWYGHDDDKDKKEYGYGKVKKLTKYALLSEIERNTLINNGELYDDVWDTLYAMPDDEYITLGEHPYVNLLSGELVSEKEYKEAYNKSRFESLENFDSGHEDALYEQYIEWYTRALIDEAEAIEDAETWVSYCPTCGTTVDEDEDMIDGYCAQCGSALVCMTAADAKKM